MLQIARFKRDGFDPKIREIKESRRDAILDRVVSKNWNLLKFDTTAIYTHGNFDKALDAQLVYMDQLLKMKPASESTQ